MSAVKAPRTTHPGAILLQAEDIMAVIGDMLIHDASLVPLELRGAVTHCPALEEHSCQDFGLHALPIAERVYSFFGLKEPLPEMKQDTALGTWAKGIHTALQGRPLSITFHSSGSTGTPVEHSQPYAYMEHEVQSVAPLFPASRVISVMPRHHCFAFVFALLLPRALGLPTRHFLPLPTKSFVDQLQEGDLVVAFPYFWEALTRLQYKLPAIVPLSAGNPCPASIMDTLIQSGTQGFCEIYGASELGAIGFRHIVAPEGEAHTPFTLLPQWSTPRTNKDGTKQAFARRLPADMLSLIPSGMDLHTTDTDGTPLVASAPLPDSLMWYGPRNFKPAGRKDKAVQVAGHNVYPARIAEKITTHPYVHECRVRLMRPEEGKRLKAFIVPSQDAPPEAQLRAELFVWCRETFPTHAVPKTISFGDSLPRTAHGKDAGW